MCDLNSHPELNDDESSTRNVEMCKFNFLNFLSSFQTLESYQDFMRSESLKRSCDWCHFPQDESNVSALGHSQTSVCPCEIDLIFSEDECTEALCVKDLIDVVGEMSKEPSRSELESSWPQTRPMGNKEIKCNYNDTFFVSVANWTSRLRQSFIHPKVSANTNNSSSNSHYDDILSQRSGAVPSTDRFAAGWSSDASDSGYSYRALENVEYSADTLSEHEIPLYQIEPALKLNVKSENDKNKCDAGHRRSQKAKRIAESTRPSHECSVIRKITPQDKNRFLCRPAIGSDENFIEIRSKRAGYDPVDSLCQAQQIVGVGDYQDANERGAPIQHDPSNIVTSKCTAGPRIRHGLNTISSGASNVVPCMPFRFYSSASYVYPTLLKFEGGYNYAKQMQSKGRYCYKSKFLSDNYTCPHGAKSSGSLKSHPLHSSNKHHGWHCSPHMPCGGALLGPGRGNRTNNARSSSDCSSCSSSVSVATSLPDQSGLRIAKVLGDGRCLFRSLVTGMHVSLQHSPRGRDGSLVCERCEAKEKRRSDRLRARVVGYMRDNAHLYSDLDSDVINADQPDENTYRKFKDRLEDMSNNATMPGEMELDAASKVLKRPIAVVNKDLRVIIVYGKNNFSSAQPLIVRYTNITENIGHFDAVIPLCTDHTDNSSSYNDSDKTRQSSTKANCSCSACQWTEGSNTSQNRMDESTDHDMNDCNHNHKVRRASRKKKTTRRPYRRSNRRKPPKKSRRVHKSVASSSHKLHKSKSSKSKGQADGGNNSGFFSMLKYYCVPRPMAKEDESAEKIEKSAKRKRSSVSQSSSVHRKKFRPSSPRKKKAARKTKQVGRTPSLGIRGYQLNPPSQRACFVCNKAFEARDSKTWMQCSKCFGEAHRSCAVKNSVQAPKDVWFLCKKCNQKWVKK